MPEGGTHPRHLLSLDPPLCLSHTNTHTHLVHCHCVQRQPRYQVGLALHPRLGRSWTAVLDCRSPSHRTMHTSSRHCAVLALLPPLPPPHCHTRRDAELPHAVPPRCDALQPLHETAPCERQQLQWHRDRCTHTGPCVVRTSWKGVRQQLCERMQWAPVWEALYHWCLGEYLHQPRRCRCSRPLPSPSPQPLTPPATRPILIVRSSTGAAVSMCPSSDRLGARAW